MEDLAPSKFVHETQLDRLLLLDYLLELIRVVLLGEILEVNFVNLVGLLRPLH